MISRKYTQYNAYVIFSTLRLIFKNPLEYPEFRFEKEDRSANPLVGLHPPQRPPGEKPARLGCSLPIITASAELTLVSRSASRTLKRKSNCT